MRNKRYKSIPYPFFLKEKTKLFLPEMIKKYTWNTVFSKKKKQICVQKKNSKKVSQEKKKKNKKTKSPFKKTNKTKKNVFAWQPAVAQKKKKNASKARLTVFVFVELLVFPCECLICSCCDHQLRPFPSRTHPTLWYLFFSYMSAKTRDNLCKNHTTNVQHLLGTLRLKQTRAMACRKIHLEKPV